MFILEKNFMKKIVFIFSSLLLLTISAVAQTDYQFTFQIPNANSTIAAKVFFLNFEDGTAQARLRFNSPINIDSTLIDMKVTEENTDAIPGCVNQDRLFFNLQKNQLIFGNDSSVTLPQYFCFKKNTVTGFFEPLGISNTIGDCHAAVTPFTTVDYLEQKNLTPDFVLTYFKNREKFYTSLFATKTRALTVNERNVKLYLLVVANTFDDSIGKACAKDMRRTISFFKDVKEFLGIQFEYDTIAGKNYNLTNVEKGIEKLRSAGPNDIVVFYYSGHGFRQNGDTRRPPYIDLRPNYNDNPNNLNTKSLADIYATITGMPARLKLVLGDCCNDLSKSYSIKAKAPSQTKGFSLTGSIQNGADLFLNANRASILAAGAEPNQRSICNDDFGGFFSFNFLKAIEGQLSFLKTNATWDKIIEETKIKTRKMSARVDCPKPGNPQGRCLQMPYSEIE